MSQQLTGLAFAYLVLSGYALRDETADILQAFRRSELGQDGNSAPPGDDGGAIKKQMNFARRAAVRAPEEKALPPAVFKKANSYASLSIPADDAKLHKRFTTWLTKIKAFDENPSMKISSFMFGGSATGPDMFWHYMKSGKEYKKYMMEQLRWGVHLNQDLPEEEEEALHSSDQTEKDAAEAAYFLADGMRKWINNQKTKKSTSQTEAYEHCEFNIEALGEIPVENLVVGTLVQYAKKLFVMQAAQELPDGKLRCRVVDRVREVATSSFAKQLVPEGRGTGVAEDPEDEQEEEGASSMLQSMSLTEADEEFVGIIIGVVLVIAVVAFIDWKNKGKSRGGDGYRMNQMQQQANTFAKENAGRYGGEFNARIAYHQGRF